MKTSMNGKFGGAVGRLAMSLLAVIAATTATAQSVAIDFVTVGYADNLSDPLTGRGSVGYDYRIGKFEVTNEQYATFLNAVAKSDPFDLYNPAMGTGTHVGITRVGVSGNFSYSVMPGFESKPIMYVSYWDAARFVNWLGTGSAYPDRLRSTVSSPLRLMC